MIWVEIFFIYCFGFEVSSTLFPSYVEGHFVSILNAWNTLLLNCPVTIVWILTASAGILGLSPVYTTSIVATPSVILKVRVFAAGSHVSVPETKVPFTVIGLSPIFSFAAKAPLTSNWLDSDVNCVY